MSVTLYLAIPCYNEEAVLPETARRLREKFAELRADGRITDASRICFIDDGSRDRTWELIAALHDADRVFSGIKLTRNRGHQNALLCGLMTLRDRADCVISMDADLQDDINAIGEMLDRFAEGCDVVYGVRSSRKTDTFFKRFTAEGFYKLMKGLGVDIVFNHADYRLMSRRAVEGLAQFSEVNLFLRGIVPQIGYKWTTVEYARAERFAGESKYPLKKMLAFAFDGITSLSVKPIRMITFAGIFFFLLSLVGILWCVITAVSGHSVPGWASTACIVLMIGGIQSLFLGIIGEYIGKIYMEVKARPRYIISDRTGETDETQKK